MGCRAVGVPDGPWAAMGGRGRGSGGDADTRCSAGAGLGCGIRQTFARATQCVTVFWWRPQKGSPRPLRFDSVALPQRRTQRSPPATPPPSGDVDRGAGHGGAGTRQHNTTLGSDTISPARLRSDERPHRLCTSRERSAALAPCLFALEGPPPLACVPPCPPLGRTVDWCAPQTPSVPHGTRQKAPAPIDACAPVLVLCKPLEGGHQNQRERPPGDPVLQDAPPPVPRGGGGLRSPPLMALGRSPP